MHSFITISLILFATLGTLAMAADWQPAGDRLKTPWTAKVDPANPLPEYPRPQLTRTQWSSLNGQWDYAISGFTDGKPIAWDGRILVPFAIESSLSGVQRPVLPNQALWYHRAFATPKAAAGERVLLHFGAVDWLATVWVNGQQVVEHRGAHDGFSADITGALVAGATQDVVVRVWDPTDTGSQARGKQTLRTGGIFYTAVTGIWQTVWLENVPALSVRELRLTPDLDGKRIRVRVAARGDAAGATIEVKALLAGKVVGTATSSDPSAEVLVPLSEVKPWSPDSPTLYDLTVTLKGPGGSDTVGSYVGLRTITAKADAAGVMRLHLNGEPLFQFGPLDQGWWPDGLYTAPTDEALRWDIEMTRRLGFNMCRKHIKTECERWYYWADRLGLMVWQDMSSAMGPGQGIAADAKDDAKFSPIDDQQWRGELRALIDGRGNHPAIVVWVPFNEGWGQHATNEVLQWTMQYDPTRLVDGPSGWTDRGVGHLKDMHNYPGPGMFPLMSERVSVLGEFGGLGLPMKGHLWSDKDNWGYRTFQSQDELQAAYEQLIHKLDILRGKGLAAAVYTQTTDVEGEVNGLITYDRAMVKIAVEKIAALHRTLYQPAVPTRTVVVVPTSESQPLSWRYATATPSEGWNTAAFDVGTWSEGVAGFGTPITPGTRVGTEWKTSDIWLRRNVTIPAGPFTNPQIRVFHDEDVTVWLDGRQIMKAEGYTGEYVEYPLAAAALTPGDHVLGVHCHQTQGGQFIDVGIVDLIPVR